MDTNAQSQFCAKKKRHHHLERTKISTALDETDAPRQWASCAGCSQADELANNNDDRQQQQQSAATLEPESAKPERVSEAPGPLGGHCFDCSLLHNEQLVDSMSTIIRRLLHEGESALAGN